MIHVIVSPNAMSNAFTTCNLSKTVYAEPWRQIPLSKSNREINYTKPYQAYTQNLM